MSGSHSVTHEAVTLDTNLLDQAKRAAKSAGESFDSFLHQAVNRELARRESFTSEVAERYNLDFGNKRGRIPGIV